MFEATLNETKSRLDRLQLVGIAGMILVGVAFVYSATMVSDSARALPWYNQAWVRQIVWCCLGIGAATAFCFVDYHAISRWSFVVYWLTILGLVLVLIPGVGAVRYGAGRWIDLGPFQLQPSEFAKISFILAMAHYLSRPIEELRQFGIFWKGIGLSLLPFALVMKEPDLGSAIVLLPTGLAMMFVAGTPYRYLLRLIGIAGVVASLFLVDVLFAPPGWWQIKLEDYQRDRLLVYFGRDFTAFAPPNATEAELDRIRQRERDRSLNVKQALISVGSGGLTGKGWGQGTQNKYGYLPRAVAHNDFIFSVIAEEKGFVGSVTVIALYGVILLTGIRIASQARDRLGKVLAAGVVTLLFSHVFINIGMNIRIMPVTGVPLPLLSYGGSSVLCSLIALGILQNVYIYRKGY